MNELCQTPKPPGNVRDVGTGVCKKARIEPSYVIQKHGLLQMSTTTSLLAEIVTYLPMRDWVQLSLTCKSLGYADEKKGVCSKMDLVSKAVLNVEKQTKDEVMKLPKYAEETWMSLLHAHLVRRAPMSFSHRYGSLRRAAGDEALVKMHGGYCENPAGTAMTSEIMRAGSHTAEFVREGGCGRSVLVGIMRPACPTVSPLCRARTQFDDKMNTVISEKYVQLLGRDSKVFSPLSPRHWHSLLEQQSESSWAASRRVHCCVFECNTGKCITSDWNDEYGVGAATVDFQLPRFISDNDDAEPSLMNNVTLKGNGSLKLHLDLTRGTLNAFVDGMFVGEMDNHLYGEYCWVVIVDKGSVEDQNGVSPMTIKVTRI